MGKSLNKQYIAVVNQCKLINNSVVVKMIKISPGFFLKFNCKINIPSFRMFIKYKEH